MYILYIYYVLISKFYGIDPRRTPVCWRWEWEDQEERSYLRKARVRLWMAGWDRWDEWGQCRKVWSSLPTILLGRQEGQ